MDLGDEQPRASKALKLALKQSPKVKLPDFSKPFIVTTEVSGFCMGGVLIQRVDETDHVIAFYSSIWGSTNSNGQLTEKSCSLNGSGKVASLSTRTALQSFY